MFLAIQTKMVIIEEHNAGEYLLCLMVKKFYNNPHSLASKEDIDKWLEDIN